MLCFVVVFCGKRRGVGWAAVKKIGILRDYGFNGQSLKKISIFVLFEVK